MPINADSYTRLSRRGFLGTLAIGLGGTALAPVLVSCGKSAPATGTTPVEPTPPTPVSPAPDAADPLAVPQTRPGDWDPIAFNRTRGNAGAIPRTYLADINGPDGPLKHLGKHLPYLPALDAEAAGAGFIALMWGDPAKGYAAHPNAPKDASNNYEGHWYNWIRIRKAVDGEAIEAETTFTNWPTTAAEDNGRYLVFGDGAITDNAGKETVYVAALPTDVGPGDVVRIWAHCLTHGEYVDFITV